MTTSLPALAVALLLAACAPVELGGQTWYKEGASTAEQQAALAAAETQARQAHVQPPEERNLVLRSMTAQGWRLKPRQTAPALDSAPAAPVRPPPRNNLNSGML